MHWKEAVLHHHLGALRVLVHSKALSQNGAETWQFSLAWGDSPASSGHSCPYSPSVNNVREIVIPKLRTFLFHFPSGKRIGPLHLWSFSFLAQWFSSSRCFINICWIESLRHQAHDYPVTLHILHQNPFDLSQKQSQFCIFSKTEVEIEYWFFFSQSREP